MELISEIGRVLLSLALILGLMWGLARFLRRSPSARDASLMDVLARQQLTRNSTITVVRVMDQALLLGVTDGQVSLLGEVDLDEAEERLELSRLQTAGPISGAGKAISARVAPVAGRLGEKVKGYLPSTAGKDEIPDHAFENDLDQALHDIDDVVDDEAGQDADTASPRVAKRQSPLDGSALSPNTWRQAAQALRGASSRGR